jgi:hypothetical protein
MPRDKGDERNIRGNRRCGGYTNCTCCGGCARAGGAAGSLPGGREGDAVVTDVRISVINFIPQQRVTKCRHPAIIIAALNCGLECSGEIPESGSGTEPCLE